MPGRRRASSASRRSASSRRPQALKPDPKKLNPLQGAKKIFGPHALFETAKSIVKVVVVGAIAALRRAAASSRSSPRSSACRPPCSLPELAGTVLAIAQRAAVAYLVIALVDFVYQRWRHEKS